MLTAHGAAGAVQAGSTCEEDVVVVSFVVAVGDDGNDDGDDGGRTSLTTIPLLSFVVTSCTCRQNAAVCPASVDGTPNSLYLIDRTETGHHEPFASGPRR